MNSIDGYRNVKFRTALIATVGALATSLAFLPGCNGPDCSEGILKAKYTEGASAATKQMAEDSARGTADGKALTQKQGFDDGYKGGYNKGFENGYHSVGGYTAGYNAGKTNGIIEGALDSYSCSDGSADGYTAGSDDGYPLGQHDGYHDGYEDGYDQGFPIGQSSCWAGSGGPSEEDKNECFMTGYNDKYSSSAYWSAFEAAKALNVNYQKGYVEGQAQGLIDGFGPGVSAGFSDGKIDGEADGLHEGYAIAYQNCYNASYSSGYNSGYSTGYSDPLYGYGQAPSYGSYSDGTGGYGDGVFDGYTDGRQSVCPYGAQGGNTMSLKYGSEQPWAKSAKGVTVDTFVAHPLLKSLSESAKAELTAKVKATRAELHTSMKANIAPRQ